MKVLDCETQGGLRNRVASQSKGIRLLIPAVVAQPGRWAHICKFALYQARRGGKRPNLELVYAPLMYKWSARECEKSLDYL